MGEGTGGCACTLTSEWLLTQSPTAFSSGPEEVRVKWMDYLVVWTGWITGHKSVALCSFVRWLKAEYSVRWYWGWCPVSSQMTLVIRQCYFRSEGVNMLKDGALVQDLADKNLTQLDKKCQVLHLMQNNPMQLCWENTWELQWHVQNMSQQWVHSISQPVC